MSERTVGEYQTLPLLPLRDVVIFPGMMMPFVVGRPRSVAALERAMEGGKRLFLAAQRDAEIDDPEANEVYGLGTIAIIVQSLKQPNGNIRVLVEGVQRARAIEFTEDGVQEVARLAGALFQYPLGWLSDRIDRRLTLIIATTGAPSDPRQRSPP